MLGELAKGLHQMSRCLEAYIRRKSVFFLASQEAAQGEPSEVEEERKYRLCFWS
jgi:hypothetical protein